MFFRCASISSMSFRCKWYFRISIFFERLWLLNVKSWRTERTRRLARLPSFCELVQLRKAILSTTTKLEFAKEKLMERWSPYPPWLHVLSVIGNFSSIRYHIGGNFTPFQRKKWPKIFTNQFSQTRGWGGEKMHPSQMKVVVFDPNQSHAMIQEAMI